MPASVRPASSVVASLAAAHERRADGHDGKTDGQRARVPDALRPAAGRQAQHGADQRDDRYGRAGDGQRQAKVVLQIGHQRRHDAELSAASTPRAYSRAMRDHEVVMPATLGTGRAIAYE